MSGKNSNSYSYTGHGTNSQVSPHVSFRNLPPQGRLIISFCRATIIAPAITEVDPTQMDPDAETRIITLIPTAPTITPTLTVPRTITTAKVVPNIHLLVALRVLEPLEVQRSRFSE